MWLACVVYLDDVVLILFDLFLMSRPVDAPCPMPRPVVPPLMLFPLTETQANGCVVDSLSFCKATENQNTKTHAHPLSPAHHPHPLTDNDEHVQDTHHPPPPTTFCEWGFCRHM